MWFANGIEVVRVVDNEMMPNAKFKRSSERRRGKAPRAVLRIWGGGGEVSLETLGWWYFLLAGILVAQVSCT